MSVHYILFYGDRRECGWLGGVKVSCIFCHPGRPADIGL